MLGKYQNTIIFEKKTLLNVEHSILSKSSHRWDGFMCPIRNITHSPITPCLFNNFAKRFTGQKGGKCSKLRRHFLPSAVQPIQCTLLMASMTWPDSPFFGWFPSPSSTCTPPPPFSTVTKRATIKPTRSQPYPCSFLPSLSAAVALNFIYYPPFLSLSKENEDSKP